jgi:hypothetical protein
MRHDIGDVAGTLAYMAPERFRGTPATVQSDLYGLGLILYETYTGKAAFKASSVREWERAHSDSTPTSPTALAADVEPAVERAILRCLEKDPAKRPASAAQVAAALPGGDPLAAALAAGETPSPELVAASGEEGTLPRWQAWTWLAACLVSLAVVFAIASKVSLANLIPLQDPVVLKAKAQSLLHEFGYRDAPVDSFETTYLSDMYTRASSESDPGGWLHLDATTLSGPIAFVYRHSSRTLLTLSSAPLNWANPAPMASDDTLVALDARDGRLILLRRGGLNARTPRAEPPEATFDWRLLLSAARLDETQFTPLESAASPSPFQFDAHAAWQGQSGQLTYRVDAAVYRGRPTYFRLMAVAPDSPPQQNDPAGSLDRTLRRVGQVVVPVLMLVLVVALAALARHNVRLGRGDRKGARRVATVMLVAAAIGVNIGRRWGPEPAYLWQALSEGQGEPLFTAIAAWLCYLGLEPSVRRRWPRLLVTSTRLLDGRWRDPLVGRSVLVGVAAGVAFFGVQTLPILLAQVFRLGAFTPFFAWGSLEGPAMFVAGTAYWIDTATLYCLVLVGVLLISRVILRRDVLAWTAVALVTFFVLIYTGYVFVPVLAAPTAVLGCAIALASMRVGGLLATVIQVSVWSILTSAPLTLDVGRWYVWRSWFVVALVLGLAFWGFRNVLGKQSAFPAGALDG